MATANRPGWDAESPYAIPVRGWKQVLWRVKDETLRDNVSMAAAGCAFFGLLSLFPAITALVSVYGLAFDPAQVEQQLAVLHDVVPIEAMAIIEGQARAVASSGRTALGWSAALALLIAFYSATSAVKTSFAALNIAYEEEETRSFIRLNLTAAAFTLAAMMAVPTGLAVILGLPTLMSYLPLGPFALVAIPIGSFTLLLMLVVAALSIVYRFGPSRAPAHWRWLSPGAMLAAGLWLAASAGFSIYVARFGSYNQTYGALAGVVILLLWLYISAFVVLLGAELNAELELQTEADSTTGPPRPMGERDAFVADNSPASRRLIARRQRKAARVGASNAGPAGQD